METEEKLQQAANKYSKSVVDGNKNHRFDDIHNGDLKDFSINDWLEGAKSPESLEYWKEKEKLYNETEIRNLIMFWDSEGGVDWREVDKYFEQNKKK